MATPHPLDSLAETIAARRGAHPDTSWTAQLLASGAEGIGKKVIEEAAEVALAAMRAKSEEAQAGVIHESADLLYHLSVLWESQGVSPAEVWSELQRREAQSGIEEKRRRSKS